MSEVGYQDVCQRATVGFERIRKGLLLHAATEISLSSLVRKIAATHRSERLSTLAPPACSLVLPSRRVRDVRFRLCRQSFASFSFSRPSFAESNCAFPALTATPAHAAGPNSPISTHCTTSPSFLSTSPSLLAGNSNSPLAPARLTVRLDRWPPVEKALRPEEVGRIWTRWYSGRGSSGTVEVSYRRGAVSTSRAKEEAANAP